MAKRRARIDSKVQRLQRRLVAWLRQERTHRNQSIIEIGARAIRDQLRTLGKQRRAVAA